MRNVIFLGAPGCGKGTQAAILVEKLGFTKVSTGDLLREIASQDSEFGRKIHQIITSGDFVSDEMVNQLIDDFYSRASGIENIILDGYPRSIDQAKALDKILAKYEAEVDQVVYFDVSEDVLVKRIIGRYTCKDCGAIYNSFFHTTAIDNKCDKCGGNDFNRRSDDSEEVIVNRLKIFKTTTEPLLSFYAMKLNSIDASASTEKVAAQIAGFL